MTKISVTKQSIVDYIYNNPQSSVVRLVDQFLISKQAMHKHLKELIELNLIQKNGSPPSVYYSINTHKARTLESSSENQILKDFVIITPIGEKLTGQVAFENWCSDRSYNIDQYLQTYQKITSGYQQYYNEENLIDSTAKIQNTFKEGCKVDKCYYASFSTFEIFGKTGIYAQMLYAKQSGSRKNMLELFPSFTNKIKTLIDSNKITAIGFVPPTVPRKVQLMKELEKYLKIEFPKVIIKKISNQYLVPQKTLSKPIERKQNAEATFLVESVPNVSNILLIDDFVGSGSSFNSIATKIKLQNPGCKIFCFAISGTPNGVINNQINKFEVINEA
jgi:DNA-binding MarR family transcriptional regulator